MIAPLLAALSRPLPPPSLALRSVWRVDRAHVDRARVACLLCTAFRAAASPHVRALHAAAMGAARTLADLAPPADGELDARRDTAVALRDRVAAMPEADRAPVLVAVVRELLTDAPDCCAALDRAVRDAAHHHAHAVTAEHEAAALALLAQECPT